MAWTAPMTAVAGAAFTANQFNIHVRDNLLETAVGKATTAGSYYVATGANALVERTPISNDVDTSQTTASTSFTDLATSGPSVTVATGSRALVIVGASMSNATAFSYCLMGVTITGATSTSASDGKSVNFRSSDANQGAQICWSELYNLTPGNNTFTAKYRVTAGTGTFSRRRMIVIPF